MTNGKYGILVGIIAALGVIALIAFVPVRPMSNLVLVVTLTILIYVTFAIGWTAHWLYMKYIWARDGDSLEMELEKRIFEAEQERDAAVERLYETQAAFDSQARQSAADLEAALDELGRARRESEYYRQQYVGNANPEDRNM